MIKYRTRLNAIEKMEVLRETDKQVVFIVGKTERRENKVSDYSNWHDTWEDAHCFLIKKAEFDVENLRLLLDHAKGKLGQIKGIKNPDVERS